MIMLEQLRQHVYEMHMELPKYNLVVWTMGNVSARDPETGYVVIKPSGVRYEDMQPADMVIVDMDANIIEGKYKYSSDTLTHLYVYRHRPDVNGVVHTHSTFATAFAAVGKPIPCFLTGMADEFGAEIPVGGFSLIGGMDIGKVIVGCIGTNKAILLQNHGVFTIGKTAKDAVKAAVMAEDAARTSYYALQLGIPIPIAKDNIAALFDRYTNVYGQH
jgi:L-ribulose-5-phosphate 4-epimerase